jgi:hypothetical protein
MPDEHPTESAVARIFGKLDGLAAGQAELKIEISLSGKDVTFIKETVNRMERRAEDTEKRLSDVISTVRGRAHFFNELGDMGSRLKAIEANCSARSVYPKRVETLEDAMEQISLQLAGGAGEHRSNETWLNRLWPLIKIVFYVIGALVIYNAKAFLNGGKVGP